MPQTAVPPFHLALPVDDLKAARAFYGDLLDCPVGRSSDRWIDWNFFGHQLVTHLGTPLGQADTNLVDGKAVPSFHFGVVVDLADFWRLADRLSAARIDFLIEPGVRFEGEAGEQATMFFLDPAGNALEIKAFKDIGHLFATD